jgi:hypothetical protein
MTKDQSKRLLEKIIKDAEHYNPEMRLFNGFFGSKCIETEYGPYIICAYENGNGHVAIHNVGVVRPTEEDSKALFGFLKTRLDQEEERKFKKIEKLVDKFLAAK